MQFADEQPHIGIPGIGRCVAVGNVGPCDRLSTVLGLVLFCVLRVAVVPGVIQFIAVKAHVQVAVQRIGLFRCQQFCAVCLCQRRHTVLVDQLNVVGVDAEFQCRAFAVVVTLGRKNAVQIIKVRRAVGEADIAVLPMISAANLYNKGIRYHLAGCPIWGTLYLVGRSDKGISGENKPVLHIFGAGTTPDILTRHYLRQHNTGYTLNYSFTTAQEIMQGLLAGKVDHAVLGEPFLSIALRKDSTLQILADLNRPDSVSSGFAQTAILYAPALKKSQKAIDSLLHLSCRFAVEQPEQAIRILEKEKIFASGMLTPESIERCKIDYRTASEAQENILRFLQLIGQYEPKALGGKMPDEKFYK